MTPDEIRPHTGQPIGTGDLREKAKHVAREAREMGEAARDFAHETADQARRAGEDYIEKGRDLARGYEDHVVEYVRANPIKSLLIALGAGLVLGSMTRR